VVFRIVLVALVAWMLVKVIQRLNLGYAMLRVLEILIWVVGGALFALAVIYKLKAWLWVVVTIMVVAFLLWMIYRLDAWWGEDVDDFIPLLLAGVPLLLLLVWVVWVLAHMVETYLHR
jgi:hypothetical protein